MGDSTDWIYDSVIGFLCSPLWMVPITNFLEEKSIVFDPGEENKLAYTEIHNEYKTLVEILLETYIQDIGIMADQFLEACRIQENIGGEHQSALQQVWAADDFNVFKHIMVQNNIELEMQALRMMHQQQAGGGQDSSTVLSKAAEAGFVSRDVLAEILRKSEQEYESQMKHLKSAQKNETEQLDKVLRLSIDESKKKMATPLQPSVSSKSKLPELKPAKTHKQIPAQDNQTTSDHPELCEGMTRMKTDVHTTPPTPPLAPSNQSQSKPDFTKTKPETKSGAEAAEDWMKSARQDSYDDTSSKGYSNQSDDRLETADELLKRQEYFKQQRERLLAMKRSEREKNLTAFTRTEASSQRPLSARLAQAAVKGDIPQATSHPATQTEDAKKLAMRRALAAKLKSEVIGKPL